MQNKTVRQLRGLLAVILFTLICSSAATASASSLEQALKATGWSVQREANGSLILKPQGSSASTQRDRISADQWPQLYNKLQAAGWIVARDADGSLILTPPARSPSASTRPGYRGVTSKTGSIHSMEQRLRDTGWQVIKKPDGSLLLYPPGYYVATKPRPCPGITFKSEITLPVDSKDEAYRVALNWLYNQPPYRTDVGRVRKILNVYLVSIVSNTEPYHLIQQIAIRKRDGAVIVLN